MGLLDDAIREHLELMRRHGANEAEIARREAEALGPVVREELEMEVGGPAAPTDAEGELSLPYDRAAEAGLTGESDLPSFEWHGSSTAEPEVPSFVSPEPLRDTEPEPEPGAADPRTDADVISAPTEMLDVVGADAEAGEPAAEEPEVSVRPAPAVEESPVPVEPDAALEEPEYSAPAPEEAEVAVEPAPGAEEPDLLDEPTVLEAEGILPEDRSANLAPEPPVMPAPVGEAAAPHPEDPAAPHPEEAAAPELEDSFAPVPGAEPDATLEPPQETAAEAEQSIEPAAPVEVELEELPPRDDVTVFWPAPTEGDPAASPETDASESVRGLGTDAAEVAALEGERPEEEAAAFDPTAVGPPEPEPTDAEDLPQESGPFPPEGGLLGLYAEDLPPEREPPPQAVGEVVEEPMAGLGPREPSTEEPPEPTEASAVTGAPEPPIEESPIEAPPIDEPPIEEPWKPPIEEPFVAGEEEAWREAGEAPGGVPESRLDPPLAGAYSEDLDLPAGRALEADAVLEPADEPPLDERPLRGPAPDAELRAPEPLDTSPGEPLEAPAGPPTSLPDDREAARGFFDETAEYERPSIEDRSPTADPDFED